MPPPPDAWRTKGAADGRRNLGIVEEAIVGLAGADMLSFANEAIHWLREAIVETTLLPNARRFNVANSGPKDSKRYNCRSRKKLGPSCCSLGA